MERMTVATDGSIKINRRSPRGELYRMKYRIAMWSSWVVFAVFTSTMIYANSKIEKAYTNLVYAFNAILATEENLKDAASKCAPPPIITDLLNTHRRTVM